MLYLISFYLWDLFLLYKEVKNVLFFYFKKSVYNFLFILFIILSYDGILLRIVFEV